MRTIKDIIAAKSKPNNTIEPNALVIDALRKLNDVNLSYLIVMDKGQFRGVFSERDYTRNVVLKGRSSSGSTVQEIMTTDLPSVQLSDTVEHTMHMMATHGTRYLLAKNGDEFAGIITIHDLLRQVIASKEDVFDSLAHQLIDNYEGGKIY
jgi:CBS domain-containing protein